MKSYESSTATLRAILAHPSLQRDKIDETMEAMAQATADARDVEEAMQINGDVALGVTDVPDDAELERELGVLVGEVEAEEDRKNMEKLIGVAVTPLGTPLSEGKHVDAQEDAEKSVTTVEESERMPAAVPYS